jgi:hypothetical protein
VKTYKDVFKNQTGDRSEIKPLSEIGGDHRCTSAFAAAVRWCDFSELLPGTPREDRTSFGACSPAAWLSFDQGFR